MNNMIDYARLEFSPFTPDNFCEIDSLILSWLSYMKLEVLPEIASDTLKLRDCYRAELFAPFVNGLFAPEDTIKLLTAVCASPRFRDIVVLQYVIESISTDTVVEQFAAVTFRLAPDLHYIAFRGTDCTFAGWKEDCELALETAVPAQEDARCYINRIASMTAGTLLVGGHSKGGNLAVYGAAECALEAQARIARVYSHDGPGFTAEALQRDGFAMIRDRVEKTIPQSSIVGLLLAQETKYDIVSSNAIGILQHNPFSWKVEGNAFERRSRLTPDSVLFYRKVNAWVNDLSAADKRRFIDAIFRIFEATGATGFAELTADLPHSMPVLLRTIGDLDKDMQQFLLKTMRLLLTAGTQQSGEENTVKKLFDRLQSIVKPEEPKD